MSQLPITLACGNYDRTLALRDGRVTPEGVELRYIPLVPEEVFFRMVRYQEFDAAELSLSTYTLTLSKGAPFVAIPVFPSRAFRHSGIYVNSDAGIEDPKDLAGRLVGVAEYQLTANVWIRGILEEHHDLPANSVRYRTGGMHEPGRIEKVDLSSLPKGIEVEPIPAGRTLSDMLVTGEIDAIYAPRTPRPLLEHNPKIRRLFRDVRKTEEEYFTKTGVFPIMHVLVIRREVYEQNRWLARSLLKAFTASRDLALDGLEETAALSLTLPWCFEDIERVRALMGYDYWSYGLNEGNERTLETFLRYSREQGLADQKLAPVDLFAPETLEATII